MRLHWKAVELLSDAIQTKKQVRFLDQRGFYQSQPLQILLSEAVAWRILQEQTP